MIPPYLSPNALAELIGVFRAVSLCSQNSFMTSIDPCQEGLGHLDATTPFRSRETDDEMRDFTSTAVSRWRVPFRAIRCELPDLRRVLILTIARGLLAGQSLLDGPR